MKKRIVSLVLALVLVVGCLTIGASASFGNVWASGFNGVKAAGLTCHGWENNYLNSYWGQEAGHNCTNYIAYMLSNKGVGNFLGQGNANMWKSWAQNARYGVDNTPAVGAIAWWGNSAGHVAYVEEINWEQEYIVVSEDNWGGDYDWSFLGFHDGGWPQAFLHIKDEEPINPPTPSNITLDNPWVDTISDTGATIHSVIRNNRQRVRAYGLEVWEKNTKKNVIDHWENIPSNYQTLNHIDIWVNTIEELGVSLKPGTDYGCFFYIDEGGKVFSGETYFKTTGASAPSGSGAPSISRLSISSKEVLVGENITFTCTSDTATGYTLGVNKDGTRVLTQEVPSGTFTTSFQEPGKYSAYVSAYNDKGMLDSGRLYFTVKEDEDDGSDDDTSDPLPETGFSDVPQTAYYAAAVQWAVENNITSGTGGGKFSPHSGCTRAQAVTFLWKAAGRPSASGDSAGFSDVSSNAYYHDAVVWAVENGITSGTGNGKFSPEQKCTRAQIVTFLWKVNGSQTVEGNAFSDVGGSAYYHDAVAWAVENDITSGTGNNKFSPNNTCTRAQIVTFLYRDAE